MLPSYRGYGALSLGTGIFSAGHVHPGFHLLLDGCQEVRDQGKRGVIESRKDEVMPGSQEVGSSNPLISTFEPSSEGFFVSQGDVGPWVCWWITGSPCATHQPRLGFG